MAEVSMTFNQANRLWLVWGKGSKFRGRLNIDYDQLDHNNDNKHL